MSEYAIIVNYTGQTSPDDWSTFNAVLRVNQDSSFKDILEWVSKHQHPNSVRIEKLESLPVKA